MTEYGIRAHKDAPVRGPITGREHAEALLAGVRPVFENAVLMVRDSETGPWREADRLGYAVDVVARQLLAYLANPQAAERWEDFPDIGEHDWNAVLRRVDELAAIPDRKTYDAAYGYLAQRANQGGEQ